MERMEFTIQDNDGIHARPAGMIVKKMQEFPCTITFEKGDKQADGKKLFSLMKLAAKKDDTIIITIDGEQEKEALTALQQIFKETKL